jgi:hypothetical protein
VQERSSQVAACDLALRVAAPAVPGRVGVLVGVGPALRAGVRRVGRQAGRVVPGLAVRGRAALVQRVARRVVGRAVIGPVAVLAVEDAPVLAGKVRERARGVPVHHLLVRVGVAADPVRVSDACVLPAAGTVICRGHARLAVVAADDALLQQWVAVGRPVVASLALQHAGVRPRV